VGRLGNSFVPPEPSVVEAASRAKDRVDCAVPSPARMLAAIAISPVPEDRTIFGDLST
jgi:hypothetical protein